jgi:amino acid transporter
MTVLFPATSSIATLILAAAAGMIYRVPGRDDRRRNRVVNKWFWVLGAVVVGLCVYSIFLWIHYLVVGPIEHASQNFNENQPHIWLGIL